jgi:hypothetical protein
MTAEVTLTFNSQGSTSVPPGHDLVIQGALHWPHASCFGVGRLSLARCLKDDRTLTIFSQNHFDTDLYQ